VSPLEVIGYGMLGTIIMLLLILFLYWVLGPFEAQWRGVRWRGQIQAPNSVAPPIQSRPPSPPPARMADDQKPTRVAMAIDPEHPPSWKVYGPRSDAPARSCTCHPDRQLQPGQHVLWWPVPHSGGGVNIFCHDGIEVDE
jgi:hypothetical protein